MLGIHHSGVVVSDLDRSIDFYVNVLGLTLLTEPGQPMCGDRVEHMVETPGAVLKGVLLKVGDAAIELHQYIAPESPSDKPPVPFALGAQHVALLVRDIVAERGRIEARGGTFSTIINVNDGGHAAGLRTSFIKDPDGVRIELVEVAYWNFDDRERNIAAYWASRAAGERSAHPAE